jgi:adenine-specific DNA-methyltransferase
MASATTHEAPERPCEEPVEAFDLDRVRAELSRARQLARIWAATIPETRRPDHAGAFAMRALLGYAAMSVPDIVVGAGSVDFRVTLDDAASELARSIGRTAAKLPRLEALHEVTSLYPALLPEHYRGVAGAFYTPPCLVGRLLDQAEEAGVEWTTAKVLDPAAGGGAFLVHAATRMLAAFGECEPKFVLRQMKVRLQGFELDPHAAALSQVSLEVVLADTLKVAGVGAPSFVRVSDTLEEPPKAIFDLVVGNPPYGRVTLTDEARKRYSRSLYGHANLYGVFTDIALRWTKRGGIIAYLTPTSFLGGQYYSALRGLLAKEAPPVAIDFVHARQGVFEDVMQETLLAVYRKGARPTRAQIHYLTVTSELSADISRNGTVGLPRPATRPWLAPRSPEHSRLIAKVEVMPCRLSDWGYSVSTGPLVWNRYKDQLRQLPGKDVHPLVWAEAVTSDGRFIYRAEKKNHAPYFKVERGHSWLVVNEPCVLVQRTTAKEQARRLIAAELPAAFIEKHGGVVVENHLNMVRQIEQSSIAAATVAVVLNSRVVDQLFRCISGSVAVSAFELEALPLPSEDAMRPIQRMVDEGAKPAVIEAAISALYGQPAC